MHKWIAEWFPKKEGYLLYWDLRILIGFVLSYIVAILSYSYFEKRFLRLKDKFRPIANAPIRRTMSAEPGVVLDPFLRRDQERLGVHGRASAVSIGWFAGNRLPRRLHRFGRRLRVPQNPVRAVGCFQRLYFVWAQFQIHRA